MLACSLGGDLDRQREQPRLEALPGVWRPCETPNNVEQHHYLEPASSAAKAVIERAQVEELALTWQRIATNLARVMALIDQVDPDQPIVLAEMLPNGGTPSSSRRFTTSGGRS